MPVWLSDMTCARVCVFVCARAGVCVCVCVCVCDDALEVDVRQRLYHFEHTLGGSASHYRILHPVKFAYTYGVCFTQGYVSIYTPPSLQSSPCIYGECCPQGGMHFEHSPVNWISTPLSWRYEFEIMFQYLPFTIHPSPSSAITSICALSISFG